MSFNLLSGCTDDACTCTEELCSHDCCLRTRGLRHTETVMRLRQLYADANPATPHVKRKYAQQLAVLGQTVEEAVAESPARALDYDLQDFQGPTAALTEGLRLMADKSSHYKQIKRMGARIPELKTNTDAWHAMKFFYECSIICGTSDDMSLAFDVAEDRCFANEIRVALRVADKSRESWSAVIKAIMRDISVEYLSETKHAHLDRVKMKSGETPSTYYTRIYAAYGVYRYFAQLEGKPFDEHDLARKWVNGLPSTLASMLSIAMHGKAFTMKEALGKAKAANAGGDNTAVPMKAMQIDTGASKLDLEKEQLQKEITKKEIDKLRENLSALNAMMPTPPPTAPHALAPPYPYPAYMNAMMPPYAGQTGPVCPTQQCGGARHRYRECPYARPCEHPRCGKEGHHISRCWIAHPELAPGDLYKQRSQKRSRSPPANRNRGGHRDFASGPSSYGARRDRDHYKRQKMDHGRERGRPREHHHRRERPNGQGRH